MHLWATTALRVITAVGGGHKNIGATGTTLLIGMAALLLVMKAVSCSSGGSDTGWTRRMLALLVLTVVALNAAVANIIFILPHIHSVGLSKVAMFGIPLLTLLAVAPPVMAALMRTRYAVTLTSTLAGLLACFLVVSASNAVAASFRGGNREFFVLRKRTETMNNFLESN